MLEYKKDHWKALIALAPAFIILSIFSFYPLFNSFSLAFMDGYNLILGEGPVYTGWTVKNFLYIFQDPIFYQAITNTLIIVVISVPLSIAFALLISISLNSIKKLQGLFQTIFFLPYVTNTIALGLVFSTLFNKQFGLINYLLSFFGQQAINWKGAGASYGSGLFVLMTYTIWDSLAFKIIIFLAGLQNIDKQYYQAAQIDGTSKWRVFWKITVPMLSPMIAYVTITSFIGSFKTYSSVIAIFNGNFGPAGNDTMLITVVGYIYKFIGVQAAAYTWPRAAAGSVILFAIILVFTILQLWVSKKKVVY